MTFLVFLIPARPSSRRYRSCAAYAYHHSQVNRRFASVLNQTTPRGSRLSEAATALNSLGVLALPFIVQRNEPRAGRMIPALSQRRIGKGADSR